MNKIFFLLFLTFSLNYFSQNVIIKGICQNQNQYIKAYILEDYFSRNEHILQEVVTDSIGRFELKLNVNQIQKVYLKSEELKAFLFVQPDETYFLDLLGNTFTNFYGENEVEINFLKLDSNDINYKILLFENSLDEALIKIFPLKNINTSQYYREVTKFKLDVDKKYAEEKNSFLLNYIKYSLALNLEDINGINLNSKIDKFNFYIKMDSIDLNNELYVRYFKRFYKDYFFELKPEKRVELIYQLDVENFDQFLNLLQSDSLIQKRHIAELASIVMLEKLYDDRFISKANLFYFLKDLQSNTRFEVNKKIASNNLNRINVLEAGSSLKDLNWTFLDQFKNKYLYIHFFKGDNLKCVSELEALNVLYSKYHEYIEFVTLYPKKESQSEQEAYYFDKINWPRFAIDKNDSLWEILDVRSFPSYILLSENLIINDLHAKSPSPNGVYETIEKTFFQIKQKIERGY